MKIAFHGGVSRDILFAEKMLLCYRCKTRHMLGENCPVVSPSPEGSDMSCTEQSGTPRDPERIDPFTENQPSAESQQESTPIEERLKRETLRRMNLVRTLTQSQLQRQAMEMTLIWGLLCQRLLRRNP